MTYLRKLLIASICMVPLFASAGGAYRPGVVTVTLEPDGSGIANGNMSVIYNPAVTIGIISASVSMNLVTFYAQDSTNGSTLFCGVSSTQPGYLLMKEIALAVNSTSSVVFSAIKDTSPTAGSTQKICTFAGIRNNSMSQKQF